MAEQKERFMTKGEFTDGPCGSHFCTGGCREGSAANNVVDILEIWRSTYEEFENAAPHARHDDKFYKPARAEAERRVRAALGLSEGVESEDVADSLATVALDGVGVAVDTSDEHRSDVEVDQHEIRARFRGITDAEISKEYL